MTSAVSKFALRNQLLRPQLLGAFQLRPGVVQRDFQPLEVSLSTNEVGPGLFDLRLEQRRIEPCDDLTFADDRIEVGVQFLDRSGNLRANLNGCDGLNGPRRSDGIDDVTLRDGRRGDGGFRSGLSIAVVGANSRCDDGQRSNDQQELLHRGTTLRDLRRRRRPMPQSFPAFLEQRVHRGDEDQRNQQ